MRNEKAVIKREQNGACSNYAERKQARPKGQMKRELARSDGPALFVKANG